jgi:pimeloyl-ACP methyl ester carboxylesterase
MAIFANLAVELAICQTEISGPVFARSGPLEAAATAAHTPLARKGGHEAMQDLDQQAPTAMLTKLEATAVRQDTPCGDGVMQWRTWDNTGGTGSVLVLLHGGAGSWRHWARNIVELSSVFRLVVPDLPGLGGSADPSNGEEADAVAVVIGTGLDAVIGPDTPYDVAGFSFGSMMAVCIAALHGGRVRSVTILGSSSIGPPGSRVDLLKVRHLEGAERVATHRINLSRLMIADPDRIDDLALVIQEWNTQHSRLKTPALSRSGALMRALERVHAPLNAIWGEFDAPANPRAPERAALLRQMRPDARVHLIPGAGHWVAYEAPKMVNDLLRAWLGTGQSRD